MAQVSITRTKDGAPAARVQHMILALYTNDAVGKLGIYSHWCGGYRFSKQDPTECSRSDFSGMTKFVADEAEFIAYVQELNDHYNAVSDLGRTKISGVIDTPWGPSDSRTLYYDGIESVGTPSHGGFVLSEEMNEIIDPEWRSRGGYYEEDADWAIVAFTFPHLFTDYEAKHAERTLKDQYPDTWERLTGKTIQPGDSWARDEQAFTTANADNYVVISAVNSRLHPGMVDCIATKGGDRSARHEQFIVPSNEYEQRNRFGFVIDETRHSRVDAAGDPVPVGA